MKAAEKKLYLKAIDKWGGEMQVRMAVEEMAELTKALMKVSRCKTDDERIAAYENVIEEMVDVQIMIDQLKLIFGGNGLRMGHIKETKLSRLDELLNQLTPPTNG